MKTIYTRKSKTSEYEYFGDFNFNYLPNQNDIIEYGNTKIAYYKVDFILFHIDENAENIKIYASKVESL